MTRMMIVLLVAVAATACTTGTTASPSTVTETVTDRKTTATKTTAETADDEGAGSAGPDDGTAGDLQPCTSIHVEAAVAPGEWPTPEAWNSSVVVTNLGPDTCSLDGTSELRFYTGGNGQRLDVNQVTSDDDAVGAAPVVLAVGEQGAMALQVPTASDPTPDCLEGGGLVEVFLPGDDEPVTARADVPPVCGAVQVTSWFAGGAPGVPPN